MSNIANAVLENSPQNCDEYENIFLDPFFFIKFYATKNFG